MSCLNAYGRLMFAIKMDGFYSSAYCFSMRLVWTFLLALLDEIDLCYGGEQSFESHLVQVLLVLPYVCLL